MGDPVVYFEILGADAKALRDFYGGLFGWQISPAEAAGDAYQLVEAEADGIRGGIGAFPGAPSQVAVYVRVDDLDAAVRRAEELGGTVMMAPREATPGIVTALVRDPEGHVVGLIRGL